MNLDNDIVDIEIIKTEVYAKGIEDVKMIEEETIIPQLRDIVSLFIALSYEGDVVANESTQREAVSLLLFSLNDNIVSEHITIGQLKTIIKSCTREEYFPSWALELLPKISQAAEARLEA